jgi:hypothetical protein
MAVRGCSLIANFSKENKMRVPTINKVISAKLEEWLTTITDLDLRNQMREDAVITGGCIVSMLLKEEVNDYDVYFKTVKTTQRVAQYYVDLFMKLNHGNQAPVVYLADEDGNFLHNENLNGKVDHVHTFISSNGYVSEKMCNNPLETKDVDTVMEQEDLNAQEILEQQDTEGKQQYRPVFITSNALTLSNKMQVITRFSGDPDEIHTNFDFDHTKMWWTKEDGVVTNTKSLEAVLAKRLVYTGSKFPLCSVVRSKKFIQRGWTMDAGQYVKMAIQLNMLDLSDPRVLMNQLTGVDTTYFAWILDQVTKEDKLIDGKVDTMYLMNLINYMFD